MFNNQTLEHEFELRKMEHMQKTLFIKAKQHYAALEGDSVNIPSFMRIDSPEKKALADVEKLMYLPDGGEMFRRLYETAWADIAEDVEG